MLGNADVFAGVRELAVDSLLSGEEIEQLRRVLLGNADVFGWSHSDMAEIDPTFTTKKYAFPNEN